MDFPGTSPFQSLLEDKELVEEIQIKAAKGGLKRARQLGLSGDEFAERLGDIAGGRRPSAFEAMPRPGAAAPRPSSALEAIVLLEGRPSLIIQNGSFETPESAIWQNELEISRSSIEGVIARTSRIELFNHMDFEWIGTGWLVAPDVIATNRHVAVEFGQPSGSEFVFKSNFLNQPISASVDFREEFESAAEFTVRVAEILYIAGDNEPDIAFLRIEADVPLPEPLELDTTAPGRRLAIGTVGYPAWDPRNGADALRDVFEGIYDVKRFAPGKVSHAGEGEHWFVHDCATLGGASGSSVFDLDTGKVIGLHFSGRFLEGNFAVKSRYVADALAGLSTRVSLSGPGAVEAVADGRNRPDHFADRDGYREDFLDTAVPLPGFGTWVGDISNPGNERKSLDYRHFSVVMSESRKLPLLTAVNIDGRQARRVFRENDKWFIDGRIPETAQLGNEIYSSNDLDRGHMVRRLDPVWGSQDEAEEANEDTFHYANSAPQHKDLNRRVWNDLEDYLLDSAKVKDLRMSVFTGPVFAEDDQLYRDLVRLPKEFWKVAVVVNNETGQLASAGYVLSQGNMIRDITEVPFVFGKYRTYQVRIELLSERTGLDFSALAAHDVLIAEGRERLQQRVRPIEGARDILI
jgi:endonuclease G